MNKSESITEITKAVILVMSEVKGIDKSMTVGSGQNTYQGVSDQDVKKIVGESMQKNGLAIFTIGIDETTQLNEWNEVDQYSKTTPKETKRKQNIFTKVKTTYLLTHISGEFIEIHGYGHGVDSQDKGAGKATTYALKYALLYQFLIPTGKIDDADSIHSEEIAKPKNEPIKKQESEPKIEKYELTPTSDKWNDTVKQISYKTKVGEVKAYLSEVKQYCNISVENEAILIERAKELKDARRITDKQLDN